MAPSSLIISSAVILIVPELPAFSSSLREVPKIPPRL
jgi:hypothetical protein